MCVWCCVQVIEEIEEMMEDSPDTDAGADLSQSDRSTLLLDVQRSTGSPGYESSECPLIRNTQAGIYHETCS